MPEAYDLIAIGSGPAGQQAALQAAQLGGRVAVVERRRAFGGGLTSSAIPSQVLRAAVAALAALARHGVSGDVHRIKREVTMDDLRWRTRQVVEQEHEAVAGRLRRAGVDVLAGSASFVDPHTLEIRAAARVFRARAARIVVAVGTVPARPQCVDFDDCTVVDGDGLPRLDRVPRTLTVVGGGAVALQHASVAAALGVQVTVVDRRRRLLGLVDDELAEALQYHLRGLGAVFRLGEEAVSVERLPGGGAATTLAGGERLASEAVLYAAGRRGATAGLELAAAGLEADARGRIAVGPDLRSARPHIFAAGGVAGSSGHAALAAEQGRAAALAAFGQRATTEPAPLPHVLLTIPELAFVGRTERDLRDAGVPYVAGVARLRDVAGGRIAGDRAGFLKLLVHRGNRRLLGVHLFGSCAAELVHVGRTVMAAGLPVDHLAGTSCGSPTFAQAYEVAALAAVDRLGDLRAQPVSAVA